MTPKGDGGPDTIDNAIPVCFECHAEIHAYNDRHPRGRKFTAEELRFHKEQWLKICATSPQVLIPTGSEDSDVGPVQALIDELEYNIIVAGNNQAKSAPRGRGAVFESDQFKRATYAGALSLLPDDLKERIYLAYTSMSRANMHVKMEFEEDLHHYGNGHLRKPAEEAVNQTLPLISEALEGIRTVLASER